MCGIAGVISFSGKGINVEKLKGMCDAIAHRGPDGAGYLVAQTGAKHPRSQQYFQSFTEKKFSHLLNLQPCIDDDSSLRYLNEHQWDLFLGHRRLAILDLSVSGFQPISDISKTVWVSYNGEIYNFREIRKALIKLGYEFFSDTDSEVLVNAYLEWGIEAIHQFNGMFAFSLWDRRVNKLFLARDRYGIKPLYYMRTKSNELVFASEIKAILNYVPDKPGINYNGLQEYFTFQNFFSDNTLFQDIHLLPPGHFIEINLNENDKLIQKQYWDFNFRENTEYKSENEYIEELTFLFQQAVKRQLVSDVEIGSYLSGGIDSGAIVAIAAKQLPYMKSFTIGFDLNNANYLEQGFDERAKSELLSYLYKTEHYEMVLKSGDMERCLPKFACHLEEPRVGQSYPNFYAAKLAGKFVKVVLSGAGGDELFGGYPWRYYRAVNSNSFKDYIDRYYQFWQRLIPTSELSAFFIPIASQLSDFSAKHLFESVFTNQSVQLNSPQDYINHSLYFESKTFLHGLLVVEDKLSMAHSLETRVPFLDNDLVDFAQKIPVTLKLNNLRDVIRIDENIAGGKSANYFHKTNDGKIILRKALQQFIPKEYTTAVKQGFSAPDSSWFKMDSNDFIHRILLNDSARIYQYCNRSYVQKAIQNHSSGQQNNRLFIWSLLNFEYFLKHFDS